MNISKIHTYNIYADISCTYLHMIAYLRPALFLISGDPINLQLEIVE